MKQTYRFLAGGADEAVFAQRDRYLTPYELRQRQGAMLETVLDFVWRAERQWQLDDRIDAGIRSLGGERLA